MRNRDIDHWQALERLNAANDAVCASEIARELGWPAERTYASLVHLEAIGAARLIPLRDRGQQLAMLWAAA